MNGVRTVEAKAAVLCEISDESTIEYGVRNGEIYYSFGAEVSGVISGDCEVSTLWVIQLQDSRFEHEIVNVEVGPWP